MHRSAHLYIAFRLKIASFCEFRLSLALAMKRSAYTRSCTTSLGTKAGIDILKNWFVLKGTKAPDVALGKMSRWGRSTPSGADLMEFVWLVTQLAQHCPTLLLTPTDVNAWFEELHEQEYVDLGIGYRQEAKRWSGVLRKGLSKYRECAKYETKMQTALNRCTDPNVADALLQLFNTLDLAPSPDTSPAKTSPGDSVVVLQKQAGHEQVEQVEHVTAIDFEALLAMPAHATSHVDFEALLSDPSDTSPFRSSHILQLALRDDEDDPILRPNIRPLPSGVGEISRALPKAKKGKSRQSKKVTASKPSKAVAKPVKARNAKPLKAVAKPKKTLSTTRHCVVSRAYKKAKKQACCYNQME